MYKANSQDIDRLKAQADIIEEADQFTTYLGFCKPGTTSLSAESWSILKIVQSASSYPIVTTSQWAQGLCSYNLKWTERANYTYSYKNF